MPAFIEPMLATLWAAPFDDEAWLYETKWDGFRVEAVVDARVVRPWTRGQQDARRYFGDFLDPPTWIDARRAIVDGEVIALDDRGEPDFSLLSGGGAERRLVYEVFDLLHLDGRSLLDAPLEERKAELAKVLRADPRVRLSEHVVGQGIASYEAARVRGLEGVMAKDRTSRYLPGQRSDRWRKLKVRNEQELVVGGWTTGLGAAADLGALLVGIHEDGVLRYAGKVGAGFTRDSRAELLEALGPLAAPTPPFTPAPPRRVSGIATTWVQPRVVVRAEFAGWTADGIVRQASYKGFDLGKDPKKVIRERPRGA
jgi:bifunctional non-homologous end joining protein LigD